MSERSASTAAKPATLISPRAGLLQRKCACGAQSHGNEECSDCAKKHSTLQRKLTIGASNDPLEAEADRIADQVMARPAHSEVSGAPLRIQRFAGGTGNGMRTAPESVDRALANPGIGLEPALGEFMQRRFGRSFSGVRVHVGATAEQSAREMNANAYTVGHDIVFGANRFAPATHEGRRLLAHELTHVVQQGASRSLIQRDTTNARLGSNPPAGQCMLGPSRMALPWKNSHKSKAKDVEIEYYLTVTPGHFCDMRPKTVALLQYERHVRVHTSQGHEAVLRMDAQADVNPPLDAKKTDFQQLHAPAWSTAHWNVEVNYAAGLAGAPKGWHTPPDGSGQIYAAVQGLAEHAAQQAPPLVHFGLSPEAQRRALEDFVEAGALVEIPEERKRLAEWEKNHPRTTDDKPAMAVDSPRAKQQTQPAHPTVKPKPSTHLDDDTLRKMSEADRYDLARRQVWTRTKAKLRYMWNHPGETLKGFARGALMLDTPQVFGAIVEDLSELLDSDANNWARAAAATGLLGKLAGWLAGIAGVVLAVLYVASWFTGVGELGTLVAGVVALVATAITSSAVESVLRAKAASKATTAEEFDRQVDAGSGALASGIVGGALLVAGAVVHVIVKGLAPRGTPERIRAFLNDFRKRLKSKSAAPPTERGTKTGSQPNTSPADSGGVPEPISDEAVTDRIPAGQEVGEVVGDYRISGDKSFDGHTFQRNIYGLSNIHGKTLKIGPIMQLFRNFIQEAKAAGAIELKITGNVIMNKNVLRMQRIVAEFGGTIRRTGPMSNEIIIPLR